MIDLTYMASALGIVFGFFLGIVLSIVFAILGYGWDSLWAFPATILTTWFIGFLLDTFS